MSRQFTDRFLRRSAGPPNGSWQHKRRRSVEASKPDGDTTLVERTRTIESHVFRGLYHPARLDGGDEHGFQNPMPAACKESGATLPSHTYMAELPNLGCVCSKVVFFSNCPFRDPAKPRVLGFSPRHFLRDQHQHALEVRFSGPNLAKSIVANTPKKQSPCSSDRASGPEWTSQACRCHEVWSQV